MTTRKCPACEQHKDETEFDWTYDRYGIPWMKVCAECHDKVEADIGEWKFDAADAGEALEPEDY